MSFEEDKRNYPIYKQINWAQANEGGPTLGTLPHASSISKKTLDWDVPGTAIYLQVWRFLFKQS